MTRLDRLARSTLYLLDIAEKLNEIGAWCRSPAETWAHTTSPAGRMVLTVFADLAEFERELIRPRTSHGGTRPRKGACGSAASNLSADQKELAGRLIGEGKSVREAVELLNCHPATLYRALPAADLSPD